MDTAVLEEFDVHVDRLRKATRARKRSVEFRSLIEDDAVRTTADDSTSLGKRLPSDRFDGCVHLRTLRALLSMIDQRGYERSAHQMAFHNAFERCTARVLYKRDWATSKPLITEHNGWDRCPSEVLISTPRRFGKTFSIAIYAAAMALATGIEIVIFSPARRASRKILERIVE